MALNYQGANAKRDLTIADRLHGNWRSFTPGNEGCLAPRRDVQPVFAFRAPP